MLPSLKTQCYNLRKALAAEHGLELKVHQVYELLSKTCGFPNFHDLHKNIDMTVPIDAVGSIAAIQTRDDCQPTSHLDKWSNLALNTSFDSAKKRW